MTLLILSSKFVACHVTMPVKETELTKFRKFPIPTEKSIDGG